MFKQKKQSFFIRREFFLKMIDFDINVMRSYQYYSHIEKFYRMNDNSKKCAKCVRLNYMCDFAYLNFTR